MFAASTHPLTFLSPKLRVSVSGADGVPTEDVLLMSELRQYQSQGGEERRSAVVRRLTRAFEGSASLLQLFQDPVSASASGFNVKAVLEFWDAVRDCSRAHAPSLHEEAVKLADTLASRLFKEAKSAPAEASRVVFFFLLDPELEDPDTHPVLVLPLLRALNVMPEGTRLALGRWFAAAEDARAGTFKAVVGMVQQFITYRLLSELKVDEPCYWATLALELLYKANAILPYTDFQNDAVNEYVPIHNDYALFRSSSSHAKQAFCNFPFIFNTAAKSELLEADAQVQMAHVARDALFGAIMGGAPINPYLSLTVRRDNLVRDTLSQLAGKSSYGGPGELKKPLRVKFHGEQGVDAGGVKKEFFVLLCKELFRPDIGMFVDLDQRGTFWFSATNFESTREFELLGLVLGLAIYNSVILDMRFPIVVYKKLLSMPVGLADYAQIEPETARGLQALLDHDENADFEAVFSRCFEASYESFGAVFTAELKPGGSAIAVTAANRKEYVDLYVDFFLNKVIERQYGAFADGFKQVCGGFAINLFRPEELELLISGSPNYDFVGLQTSCLYDGGFTKDSPVVVWFWEIVHSLPENMKRRLLHFCTGSDRVPIRGLASLGFKIQRASSDSEHWPSAHTCFNTLLLPEYATKDKLEKLLFNALQHGEGFGLI